MPIDKIKLPDNSTQDIHDKRVPGIDSTPTSGSGNLITSGGVKTAVDTKQDTLVSGINIKTINGTSLLGSGDIETETTVDLSPLVDSDVTFTERAVTPQSGVGRVPAIKGKSIVWNQLVGQSDTSITVTSGHVFLSVIGGVKNISTSEGEAIQVTGGTDMVFDLTLMFGSGNEPSTVADFEAQYPLSYYDYNAGTLVNNAATGIRTVGFNQWDEQWERGTFNTTTGANISNNQIRSKNLIHILPNTKYYVKMEGVIASDFMWVMFYDSEGNIVTGAGGYNNSSGKSVRYAAGAVMTPPSRARSFKFYLSSLIKNIIWGNRLVINISDTSKNGQYEPYEEHTLPLNLTSLTGKLNGEGSSVTVFPEGLRSAGTVHDEISGNKAIVRVGKVDLGTLSWAVWSANYPDVFYNTGGISDSKRDGHLNVIDERGDIPIPKVDRSMPDKSVMLNAGAHSANTIAIRDSAYSTGAAFKTAVSGVYLYYQLATPQEYILDEPLDTNFDTGATEQRLPADTASSVMAPFRADMQYGLTTKEIIGKAEQDLASKEDTANKVTSLSSSSTDTEYPSAKCIYDIVGDIETLINAL